MSVARVASKPGTIESPATVTVLNRIERQTPNASGVGNMKAIVSELDTPFIGVAEAYDMSRLDPPLLFLCNLFG